MKHLFSKLLKFKNRKSGRHAIPMHVYGYEILTGYIGEKMHAKFQALERLRRYRAL